jgi:hypothetical protein
VPGCPEDARAPTSIAALLPTLSMKPDVSINPPSPPCGPPWR